MNKRRFLEAVKAMEKNRRIRNRLDPSARRARSRDCGWGGGMLHLSLEEFDDTRSGHPLERIPLPTPLDHVPHVIRDLGVNRPRWPVVLEHREDYCSLRLTGERGLAGKNLGSTPVDKKLEIGRHAKVWLTSQAKIPKAKMSVAFVIRAWTRPKAGGLISSGAIPQNNGSVSMSAQLAGREREKVDPKPPRRAIPSLSTRTFL